jgi:S-adenosylmethionine-dependent methyltransferase
MKSAQDRNFDTLADKFEQQVYNTFKGDWRLKLLKEDLDIFHQTPKPLAIWDAGCGFAQISHWLAKQGHHLTLCDLSGKMLAHARQQFSEAGLIAKFHQEAAQTLAPKLPPFDLVLFHAVLEWLADPVPTLQIVAERVKPGGHLSLLFYNRNAMIYTIALKGDWRWRNLLDDAYLGKGKRLTPPHPPFPHEIIEHLQRWGFMVTTHTGIRVFHDYLGKETLERGKQTELFELEYRYCRMPTYRDMGRYIHLVAQR